MASDMEGLSKAEEELLYLQAKLHQSHSKLELMELNKQQQQDQHQTDSCGDIMEVSRLKEQVSCRDLNALLVWLLDHAFQGLILSTKILRSEKFSGNFQPTNFVRKVKKII
jgi:hypothetical protein